MAGTAPAPYNGPMPDSGAFGIYQAQAATAYQNAMAQIQNQRSSLLQQSGFGANYDPTTGAYLGLSGPLANAPTGTYQQMMGANAQQHAADQAAISGLGFHGGLARQAHEASQRTTGQRAADYAAQLAGSLSDLTNQETNQTDQYQSGLTQEMLNEVNSGVANQAFNPGDPGAPGSTPAPTQPPAIFKGVTPAAPTIVGRTKSGQPIYGYGQKGNPFLSAAAAKAAGRLGKRRGA